MTHSGQNPLFSDGVTWPVLGFLFFSLKMTADSSQTDVDSALTRIYSSLTSQHSPSTHHHSPLRIRRGSITGAYENSVSFSFSYLSISFFPFNDAFWENPLFSDSVAWPIPGFRSRVAQKNQHRHLKCTLCKGHFEKA